MKTGEKKTKTTHFYVYIEAVSLVHIPQNLTSVQYLQNR